MAKLHSGMRRDCLSTFIFVSSPKLAAFPPTIDTLQTPLCHISLLCQNRGTPNAVYRKAWQNNSLNLLVNKLVRYEVTADTFLVRSATEAEAQAYWKKQEKRKSIQLKVDSTEKRLFTATELSYRSVSMVGGKAANFFS